MGRKKDTNKAQNRATSSGNKKDLGDPRVNAYEVLIGLILMMNPYAKNPAQQNFIY